MNYCLSGTLIVERNPVLINEPFKSHKYQQGRQDFFMWHVKRTILRLKTKISKGKKSIEALVDLSKFFVTKYNCVESYYPWLNVFVEPLRLSFLSSLILLKFPFLFLFCFSFCARSVQSIMQNSEKEECNEKLILFYQENQK